VPRTRCLFFTMRGQLSVGDLLATGACAVYARYLFRGGRFVLIPVPGCLVSIIVVLCCIAFSVAGIVRIA
jgi:hypothetical protein